MAFWLPWIVDAAASAVLAFFFCWGVADGTVSSFNVTTWMGMLAAVGGVTGGAWWLRSQGRTRAAITLAWVLALPALLFLLFFAALVILQPDYR